MSDHIGGRRPGVLGALLCLVVLTGGCVGVLTGSEPFVATASEVGVEESAFDETDFELEETDDLWLNETVEAAGHEREIRIRNHVAIYQIPPSVELDGSVTFGMVSVFSTPQASIAGQALNPIGRMDHEELVEVVAGDAAEIRDVERTGSTTLTVLDTEAEVTRFSAVAERSGHEVPVFIEVTRVESGDDYVLAIGVYPQDAEDVEAQVETMFEAVQH